MPVFQGERLNQIIRLVRERGYADINELARMFNVSKVTIRRDVEVLVERGIVERTHGGILACEEEPHLDLPFSMRLNQNTEIKESIGRKAAALIEPGDIVYLDAGTTTFEIARNIRVPDVTVVTHDLYIALEIATRSSARLIVTGGMLEKGVYTLTGENTADFVRRLHVNKGFLGCDAIDISFGVSNRVLSEVPVKVAIREASDCFIAITDSTKLHQKALYSIYQLSQLDKIVTDSCDEVFDRAFAEAGVEVVLAGDKKA